MKYKVTLIDDQTVRENALVRLWTSSNLHAGRDPRIKYRWFYLEAPLGSATAFFLEQVDPASGQDIVGCCGLGTRRLWVDGHAVNAGLFADFAVEPEHRTVMPALILQRGLCASAREKFPVTYGFPNDAAVGIFQRIGFPLLGTIGRFVKILRHEPFVRRVVRVPGVSHALGAVVDAGARIGDRALVTVGGGGYGFKWCEAPDERFDALFERVRGNYRFIGDRTSSFLRWRFAGRPGLHSDFGALVDSRGELQGYAVVLQKHSGQLILADFLASSDAALRQLLIRLSIGLRSRGVESITAYFLGSPAVSAVLLERGFKPRASVKHIVVGAGVGSQLEIDALKNTNDWYLTEADRDN